MVADGAMARFAAVATVMPLVRERSRHLVLAMGEWC